MMINEVKNIAKCFPLTKTSFCINGDEFPPELLTEQFHLSPTVAWRKGELRKDFLGNRYYEKHPDIFPGQYTFSHWRYSTEYKQVHDIMKSVALILEEFVPLIDSLLCAKSKFSLSYKICIAMKRDKTDGQPIFPGMILSRELIEFVDTIGAEISLDFEGMIL